MNGTPEYKGLILRHILRPLVEPAGKRLRRIIGGQPDTRPTTQPKVVVREVNAGPSTGADNQGTGMSPRMLELYNRNNPGAKLPGKS